MPLVNFPPLIGAAIFHLMETFLQLQVRKFFIFYQHE